MLLYSYWRSTTSYRVRAALNLKNITYEQKTIDLVAGEQKEDEYLCINPSKGVPALKLDDGTILKQSMAILEYLDSSYPEPLLIPQDPRERAKVMAAAHSIALDIHPVNNLRIIGQLKERFGASPQQLKEWMCHWMKEGLASVETQLAEDTPFAFGHAPDIADICIVSQVYNAHRWELDMTPFPKIRRVENACLDNSKIAAAHPDKQPDAKEA